MSPYSCCKEIPRSYLPPITLLDANTAHRHRAVFHQHFRSPLNPQSIMRGCCGFHT
ncbi:hypothetical protein KCP70_02880 [Salmonella enterica subsp. enterica]|nr:hypothetical protein KCP70_02880 [Salmonella enterica subsp. enterica]